MSSLVSSAGLSALLRDNRGLVLSLIALRFATLMALPLSILGVGHDLWVAVPIVGGFALEVIRIGVRQALRRRLRDRCFRSTAEAALDKASPVPEADVESAFWAAQLAEYIVSVDFPAVAGAALACLSVLVLVAIELGLSSALATGGLVLTAGVLSLLSNRWRTKATESIVNHRQATAGLLAAAERDVGEIYGDRPRRLFLDQLSHSSLAWCRADEVLERRQVVHRLLVSAFILAGAVLLALREGLDPRLLTSETLLGVGTVSHVLLIVTGMPIAFVLVLQGDSLLVSRSELYRLQLPARRVEGASRPLARRPERLQVSGLKFSYGAELALDIVELDVALQGLVALVGPNGSGKTTFGALLVGFLRPTRGSVTLDGEACSDVERDALAFVPQQPLIIDVLSVEQNMRLVAPEASEDTLQRYLEKLGFTRGLHERAGSLSRGEQRRVAIARALSKNPKLIVLDEPDSWLDADGQARLGSLLHAESAHRSIVLISHRLEFVPAGSTVIELAKDHTLRTKTLNPPNTVVPTRTAR